MSWGLWKTPEAEVGVLGDVSGLDVVELGCGTAYFSAWLARCGARVVGVDPTSAQLETARRMQSEFGPEFGLVEGFGEEVPLPDASFDLALSEYGASLFADPDRWIPEAHRLLRPGGRLVFMRPSPLLFLCAGEHGLTEQLHHPMRGMKALRETGGLRRVRSFRRRATRASVQNWIRRREPRRGLRAGGRTAARALLVHHSRMGDEVAGRGDLGGAQALPTARP